MAVSVLRIMSDVTDGAKRCIDAGVIPVLIVELEKVTMNNSKRLHQYYLKAVFNLAYVEQGAAKFLEYGAEPLIKRIATGIAAFIYFCKLN